MILDDQALEDEVKLLIMELMLVLHNHGIKEINVGGLMRVIGVDNATAHESDDDLIILEEKFTRYLKETVNLSEAKPINKTVH